MEQSSMCTFYLLLRNWYIIKLGYARIIGMLNRLKTSRNRHRGNRITFNWFCLRLFDYMKQLSSITFLYTQRTEKKLIKTIILFSTLYKGTKNEHTFHLPIVRFLPLIFLASLKILLTGQLTFRDTSLFLFVRFPLSQLLEIYLPYIHKKLF